MNDLSKEILNHVKKGRRVTFEDPFPDKGTAITMTVEKTRCKGDGIDSIYCYSQRFTTSLIEQAGLDVLSWELKKADQKLEKE